MQLGLRNGRRDSDGGEIMEVLLKAEDLRVFQPGAWEQEAKITGQAGERIFLQGSHKSCLYLFEILCGLRKPDRGFVQMDFSTIGAIPYGIGFLPELCLLDQVTMEARLRGCPARQIQDMLAENAMEQLPFHCLYNPACRSDEYVKALAAILQATFMGQKILIFHDPFRDLPAIEARIVWKELEAVLHKDRLFIYLSSDPAPDFITWTQALRIL